MAAETVPATRPGPHRPFTYTPLEGPDGRERHTNTEASRLVCEVIAWASQFKHESSDAFMLCDAMRDMERLLASVGSKIDESLWRLKLMEIQPKDATEHLQVARRYMNRWQDRGGHIGNANMPQWARGS